MIKLLIAILITILLIAFGINSYDSGKSTVQSGTGSTQVSSPADAIPGAKNAVGQTQNLQDKTKSILQQQTGQ